MIKMFYGLCLSGFLVFTSCMSIQDLQVKDISSFELQRLDTKGLDAVLKMRIENPNRLGFTIYPSVFEVKYSGLYLGQARLLNRTRIKGRSEETYAFQLSNDFKQVNLIDIFALLKPGGLKNEIHIQGDLKTGTCLLRKSFKIDFKENLGLN
ncbi:MAG TPA: LEA type 2 family protein [Bacteroidia bacterium]|nr:LEA type 2 family protein [Bacteroidia bacterium]